MDVYRWQRRPVGDQSGQREASGRGDDVIVVGGTATTARITHRKGGGSFTVHAHNLESGEGGLLVNEIGGYAGTRRLEAPTLSPFHRGFRLVWM
ncbi:hypothetical protein [Micromonospora sp. NPDC001898]|uniref:hypothetical protein n=1 Tax=Micromonospora sp. NPDC001898 TaxID=3364221 RepID=UPI0036C17D65